MTLFHLRTLLMLSAIAAAFLFFLLIPQPRSRVFRLGGLLTAMAFATELYGYVSGLSYQNNVIVYNAFVLVEFVLVLQMARVQQPGWSKWLVGAALLGVAGFACNALLVDPLQDILFEGTVWLSFLVACVLCALLWRMADTMNQDLRHAPVFWLFTGMGLYFIALPPVMGLARYLRVMDMELASTLWTIMPLLCTARYLLTAYACWLQGGRRRAAHE